MIMNNYEKEVYGLESGATRKQSKEEWQEFVEKQNKIESYD